MVFFSNIMAEQNFNPPSESITSASHSETTDSDIQIKEQASSSVLCDSRLNLRNVCSGDDDIVHCKNKSPKTNTDVSSDTSVKIISESKNGVSDICSNKVNCDNKYDLHQKSMNTFLAPSALAGGSNDLYEGSHSESSTFESTPNVKYPLKSPKLNLTSKFGNPEESSQPPGFVTKSPFQPSRNPFACAVCFDNDKNESLTSSRSNILKGEVNFSDGVTPKNLNKPIFSSFSNTIPVESSKSISSSILLPNFVFGQNLHERVVDGIATSSKINNSIAESANGNGTSDMLFTSVLTSNDKKGNLSSELSTNTREPFSLIEDAARYQEARANKRKYEEVLVTTGEEDEENILQVSVKLFAFDSGTWVERGRGILRLNDKNSDGVLISRIVVRTVGSLRVVLNTKIWSGMSLSRTSERSVRLTALDPNGQPKIFLIQASPKDTGTLYRFLDIRVKRCQDNQCEPERKKTEKASEDEEYINKNKS